MRRPARQTIVWWILWAVLAWVLCIYFCGCNGTRTSPPKPGHDTGDGSALLLWMAAVSIAGFGICVAAAIFLPIKKLAIAGAAGFLSTMALALTVKAALPYLPWVALALGLIGIATGIWYFRKYSLGLKAAVQYGCDVAKCETDAQVTDIRRKHEIKQLGMGVKTIIEKVVDQVKK